MGKLSMPPTPFPPATEIISDLCLSVQTKDRKFHNYQISINYLLLNGDTWMHMP